MNVGEYFYRISQGDPAHILGLEIHGPLWLAIIRILFVVGAVLTLVPGLIWLERRLLSWMQDRIGPNRSGTVTFPDSFPIKGMRGKKVRTFGLIQPLLDGVKLFLKEDITPADVDRKLYFLAPALALFPAFAVGATMPWGPNTGVYGLLTPIADIDVGVLYILAISSLGAYGVVLAGYASNNKYSLMGALRASAQLISYELSMAVAIACVALAAGSMKLTSIVTMQEGPIWGFDGLGAIQNWFIFTPFGFIAAIIFLIALVAETNRAPFDLPEAENELIAGYHTEYSSMKFAVFFMGEYAAMFIMSGIFSCLFLGGYNMVPINWEVLAQNTGSGFYQTMHNLNYWLAPLVFLGKCFGGMAFFIWVRATLPRLRYDQLMSLGWKTMLPTAVANLIIVMVWILLSDPAMMGPIGGWVVAILAGVVGVVIYLNVQSVAKANTPSTQTRTVDMVNPAPRRSVAMVDPEG